VRTPEDGTYRVRQPRVIHVDAAILMCCRGAKPWEAPRALETRGTATGAYGERGGNTLQRAELHGRTAVHLAMGGGWRSQENLEVLGSRPTGRTHRSSNRERWARKDVEGARNP
jgi:hypothetical protein